MPAGMSVAVQCPSLYWSVAIWQQPCCARSMKKDLANTSFEDHRPCIDLNRTEFLVELVSLMSFSMVN